MGRYVYDGFGLPTVTDGNGENPRPYSWYENRFMFTGREYFPELGLYDYRNRFYHPILGRFLQSDPISFGGGDANLFRYCGGDPVNFSDPSGLQQVTKQTLNGNGPPVIVSAPMLPEWDPPNYANGNLLTNAIDWGSFGEIMQYTGGGDHGWSGGGFRGLGDGPLAGGFSLGPPLPPIPAVPAPVFDPRTERNIATLIPALQVLARQHMSRAQQAGLDMRIINGSRTFAEQNALYALGRTRPGQIVTNARGGESNHNFGTAYDIGIFSGTIYITDGPQYDLAGQIGVGLGLEWGGNWTGDLVDRPHFEYPGGR